MKVAFYGNCQMQALAGVYVRFVYPHTGGDVRFIEAYRPITEPQREFIADAALLVVQKLPMAIPIPWQSFSTQAQIHIVPNVSAEFLWPYAGEGHPRNPRGPGIEDGVWPGDIGDAFLNRHILAGTRPDTAVAAYLALDLATDSQLDRRYELALDRLRGLEAGTIYRAADLIEAHFRTESLFSTPNHPGLRLSRYMALSFLREIGANEIALARADKYLTAPTYPTIELPIHPGVAAHHAMTYGGADQQYRFYHESRLTFAQYARQYVIGDYNDALFAGLQNVRDGEYAAALENLPDALRRSPASAEGHAALAEAHLRSGQTDAALRSARRAASLEPDDANYLPLIGKMQASAGDFTGARRSLQAATVRGAEPGPGFRAAACIASELGCHAEAIQFVLDGLRADPQDKLTLGFAEKLLSRAQDPIGAEAAWRAATDFLRADRVDEALQAARRAVALNPRIAVYWAGLGDLLMRTKATAEGEAAFGSAIALAPDDPGPRRQLAHWLRLAGNIDAAIPQMRKVVELAPRDAENNAVLAQMLAQNGDFSAAEQFLGRAVDLAPDMERYRSALAYILQSQRKGRNTPRVSLGN